MTNRQNAHLTYKGNVGAARHNWLRLTPAYSYGLVGAALRTADPATCVLDPFAGTGTTGLVAAEQGMRAQLLDINPFLVWLARAKTRNYGASEISAALQHVQRSWSMDLRLDDEPPEIPAIHRIARWWSPNSLNALARLKSLLDSSAEGAPQDDLLAVAFCRVMIASSNAAFNHQSMSFKKPAEPIFDHVSEADHIFQSFGDEVRMVFSSASAALPGSVTVAVDDARRMDSVESASVDLLYTSPPYANRMSYIRELRPYMYWLGFLSDARQAGELDWEAIGGTWGVATSRVATWETAASLPLGRDFAGVLRNIAETHAPNSRLLSNYVHKYFFDIFAHFKAAFRVIRSGGLATYIVGNSTYYGNIVPTERWYADLLSGIGFEQISIKKIRKRNSKKELFEFEVRALRP